MTASKSQKYWYLSFLSIFIAALKHVRDQMKIYDNEIIFQHIRMRKVTIKMFLLSRLRICFEILISLSLFHEFRMILSKKCMSPLTKLMFYFCFCGKNKQI